MHIITPPFTSFRAFYTMQRAKIMLVHLKCALILLLSNCYFFNMSTVYFNCSFYSSYRSSKNCRPFLPLKSISISLSLLFAIAFKRNNYISKLYEEQYIKEANNKCTTSLKKYYCNKIGRSITKWEESTKTYFLFCVHQYYFRRLYHPFN